VLCRYVLVDMDGALMLSVGGSDLKAGGGTAVELIS
jgi:hypothetical protein